MARHDDDGPKLYLGLDSSTQSLTAIVIEAGGSDRIAPRVVFEDSLVFDDVLSHYGTRHGVLHTPGDGPAVAVSSPLMWAEALALMLDRLGASKLDLGRLAAISGSAQQHGSVYLNGSAARRLSALDPARSIVEQVAPMLSRDVSPIWLDSSTSGQCLDIAEAVGGNGILAQRTGSRAFERFTGPQIRRFFQDAPESYAATDRIHLVSSFLASLLAGHHAPLDPGDASGMNLMDLRTRGWWAPALEATAPGLAARLPAIVPSSHVVGTLAAHWQRRCSLPAAKVIAWSGDNPCSLVGVGLVREGRVAVSLGTSDTIFGLMREPRVDAGGTGHVFGAPTGDYMGLTCFRNGSLARERIRDEHGLSWAGFSAALESTPPGNGGRLLLPWFESEITPAVSAPGVRRYGLADDDFAGNVRGVVEGQLMAMALHSRWMAVAVETIHATGGAAVNAQILQVMADVFGATVHRLEVTNSAALGAAVRAWHADRLSVGHPIGWDDAVASFTRTGVTSATEPAPESHTRYRALIDAYAACEAHALGQGPDPSALLDRLRATL